MSVPVYILCPKKLRAHARRAGRTQGEIAFLVGVKPSTVSRWFGGTSQPRGIDMLEELAVAVDAERWRDISKLSRPKPKPTAVTQPGDDW